MTRGPVRHQPATTPWLWGRQRSLAAGLLFAATLLAATAGAASATVWARSSSCVESRVPDGGVEIAADFKAPGKPPPRGSSADLYGGSSADRYGGSSADRSGVAGRRDIRNRGVHAPRPRARDDRRSRNGSDNQDQQDEHEEEREGDRP